MKRKTAAVLLSFVLCFALLGCGGPTASGTEHAGGDKQTERGEMDDLVKNFWETAVMRDEPVMLVAPTDENGNVTAAPRGKLLLPATAVLSVKQYYHASLDGQSRTFGEGSDFEYRDGYIVAMGAPTSENGKTVWQGTMPYVTDRQVSGQDAFPDLPKNQFVPGKADGEFLPFTEGREIVQMQLAVTYRHAAGAYTGAVPSYCGKALSRTVAKLNKKEKTELFVYGDSISTGANCSSFLGIAPALPSWMALTRANLAAYYGAEVVLTNKSVGGWTSNDAVSGGIGTVEGQRTTQLGLSALFNTKTGALYGYKPDIAVVGFGMNDATLGVTIERFKKNISSLVFTLREANPACDIILVGTMLPNPDASAHNKNQAAYAAALEEIAAGKDGIAVVNVGLLHASLLEAGKRYIELSGNNVNHPNDFMTRVYAMHMLTALCE